MKFVIGLNFTLPVLLFSFAKKPQNCLSFSGYIQRSERKLSMPARLRKHSSEDAADAFYGQSESSFDDQLQQLGAIDPRLVAAFKRTRDRYLEQQRDQRPRLN
ncbi:hypothetical protein ACJ5NV_09555 [Loktanella agnita]